MSPDLNRTRTRPAHRRGVRGVIFIVAWFIALTAIGGGVAMLTGVDEFPLEWLRNTPFESYTVPALLLVVVGTASLVAAVAILKAYRLGVLATIVAGALMAGYIAIEVLVLEQTPPGPTWTETLYFGLGALLFGLGLYLWRTESHQ